MWLPIDATVAWLKAAMGLVARRQSRVLKERIVEETAAGGRERPVAAEKAAEGESMCTGTASRGSRGTEQEAAGGELNSASSEIGWSEEEATGWEQQRSAVELEAAGRDKWAGLSASVLNVEEAGGGELLPLVELAAVEKGKRAAPSAGSTSVGRGQEERAAEGERLLTPSTASKGQLPSRASPGHLPSSAPQAPGRPSPEVQLIWAGGLTAELTASLQRPAQVPLLPAAPEPQPGPGQPAGPLGCSFRDVEIQYELGGGSFGIVFAVLLNGKMPAAVKLPKEPGALLLEGYMHAQFNHPNVVRFGGFIALSDEGKDFGLCMELVAGGSLGGLLRSWRKAGYRPTLLEIGEILLAALRGVAYLHEMGVVHFDIKPDNMLLERGLLGQWVVKIADFGASVYTQDLADTLTQMRGTPAYMAPELVTGDLDYKATPAVDVWSIGVTMWELLTLAVPYSDIVSVDEVYRRLRSGSHPLLPPASCPKAWADVLQGCFKRDPAARSSCESLVSVFESFVQPQQVREHLYEQQALEQLLLEQGHWARRGLLREKRYDRAVEEALEQELHQQQMELCWRHMDQHKLLEQQLLVEQLCQQGLLASMEQGLDYGLPELDPKLVVGQQQGLLGLEAQEVNVVAQAQELGQQLPGQGLDLDLQQQLWQALLDQGLPAVDPELVVGQQQGLEAQELDVVAQAQELGQQLPGEVLDLDLQQQLWQALLQLHGRVQEPPELLPGQGLHLYLQGQQGQEQQQLMQELEWEWDGPQAECDEPLEEQAEGDGWMEEQEVGDNGPEEVQAEEVGATEEQVEGGGPMEEQAEEDGPMEVQAEGDGPMEEQGRALPEGLLKKEEEKVQPLLLPESELQQQQQQQQQQRAPEPDRFMALWAAAWYGSC